MKFGEIPVGSAAGAILAHSMKLAGRALRKGRVLSEEDVAALGQAGLTTIIGARLTDDELGEDAAATCLAHAVAGANINVANAFTGRANLFAETRGLCIVDRTHLDALNLVDEAATLATLRPDRRTAIVTLTHDPKIDDPALTAALRSQAFYIGALGSRRTHASRCQRLSEAGFTAADLARIHGPIGLNIGALSPAEIAISILGQITAVLRADRLKAREAAA